MPKYTYSSTLKTSDPAALVLPTKPRIVLDKGVATEVSQEDHDKLVKHKIIGALISLGEIKVEGAKAQKPEKTAEEITAEAAAKELAKQLKAVRTALTKKGVEFSEDETLEELEAKLAQADTA